MTSIGFIGGTGPLGRGLALRLAAAGHDVVLGSRDAARAEEEADGLAGVEVAGMTNADACDRAEMIFVTVPFSGQAQALPDLAERCAGKIVVSTVVPIAFDERGPHPIAVAAGSAAEECQTLMPQARVVAGFQWVPAPKLLKPDVVVDMDVPLCADDEDAAASVATVAADVRDLHAFIAGPLRLSHSLEALTPVLISANKRYKAHTGVRFVGLPRG